MHLGVTSVIVEDARVTGHTQMSSLHVVVPDTLHLYMLPLSHYGDPIDETNPIPSVSRWYVVSGRNYLVLMKVFSRGPGAKEIYITEKFLSLQNDDVKLHDDQSGFWNTLPISDDIVVKHALSSSRILEATSYGLGKLTATLMYSTGEDGTNEVLKVVQEIMVCNQVKFIIDSCAKVSSDYKWFSTDMGIVSVSAHGVVQAKKPGKATSKVVSNFYPFNYDELSSGRTEVAVSFARDFISSGSSSQSMPYTASTSLWVVPDLPLVLGAPMTWILPSHYTSSNLLPSSLSSYSQYDAQSHKGTISYSLLRQYGGKNEEVQKDAISIDGDRIRTMESNNLACIQAEDRVSQIRITTKDVHRIDLAVGAELDLPISYYDILGIPFHEAHNAILFNAETNYPDIVSINVTSDGNGNIQLKKHLHSEISVGSHLYPQNPVFHLGSRLNFSVEELNDQVFGLWLSANESVIYVDMMSGKAEAIGEVIFKNSSLKLQTAVTVLKGTIVFIDAPKEMLTNVPIPTKGYSFPVRFSDDHYHKSEAPRNDLQVLNDCRVDPTFVRYAKPWKDLSGNSYCLFFPYSPEHLVHSIPKSKDMRQDLSVSVHVLLRGANHISGSASASALFVGGFSILEMDKDSMRLYLMPDSKSSIITIVGNTDVEVQWHDRDQLMINLTHREDFGLGGRAQYEVKGIRAQKFTDTMGVEIDVDYEPGGKSASATTMSPRTPQPFIEYVRRGGRLMNLRTIDEKGGGGGGLIHRTLARFLQGHFCIIKFRQTLSLATCLLEILGMEYEEFEIKKNDTTTGNSYSDTNLMQAETYNDGIRIGYHTLDRRRNHSLQVLPPSAHAVKSTASKFLLDWLFQYEHEHRQWSAVISLGLISSCLHVTDYKQKFQNIEALIQVSSCSRSTLVKGAYGVGLGFSCQDLLTWVEASDDSDLEKETCKMQEVDLLGNINSALSQMISQFTPSSSDLLQSLSNDLEEDIWGIAGLVLSLGSSIGAIYRSGAYDVVQKIKAFILSWIPHLNHSVQNSLNSKVALCQRVELMYDNELDQLVIGFMELVSELVSVRKSGIFHQSLLMASFVEAGSLLACILNEGVHSLKVEVIKDLLVLFRKSYSNPHPPLTHFGGMLGAVNALGAGAGTLVPNYPLKTLRTTYDQKDSFYIMGPLLSCPVLESQLTSLVQEMFLVAQNSDDHQLQQYAAWAVSFFRHCLWFRELQNTESSFPSVAASQKYVSQNFLKDNVVKELSLCLMHLNCPGVAPRLPALDWGAIIRRGMKYEGQMAESLSPDLAFKSGILGEKCLQLSLAHANQFDPLLSFLNELSDLSRFRTLELNLQSWFLSHLADLIKIFSGSGLEKLFDDVANFLSSLFSGEVCTVEQQKLIAGFVLEWSVSLYGNFS
ncbi:unnamed protein product [Camellia sinensis]